MRLPAPCASNVPFRSPPESLTRVSPAVLRPGIHLGIHRQEGELWVWGATRKLPPYSFVLEVIAPGLLVVKHSRAEDAGKYVNVAVIEGDRIKVIDETAAQISRLSRAPLPSARPLNPNSPRTNPSAC